MNVYYDGGSERADRVKVLFGRIARGYDRTNDLQSAGLHRRWKREVVRLAAVGAGQSALDVCCGTGDIAFALAATGSAVTGLDFSSEMLDAARRRWDARSSREGSHPGGGLVQFVEGDALELPFACGAFDAVTMGFGLRNLSSFRRGLAEMCRVVRPGGRVVILDFGKPANRLWRAAYFGYLAAAVPLLGRVSAGDSQAYAYILESLRHYPGQEQVAGMLRDLGAEQVQVRDLLGGAMSIVHGSGRGRFMERPAAGEPRPGTVPR